MRSPRSHQALIILAFSCGTASAAPHDLTRGELVDETLVRVQDRYFDPARVEPMAMLLGALASVQASAAEILVDPSDVKAVSVTVNAVTRSFDLSTVDSIEKASARLKEIFRFVQAHLSTTSDRVRIEYAAVNGMLATLDPHSAHLDLEAVREMHVKDTATFGGVGVTIALIDDKASGEKQLTVTALVVADGPAARAGVKPGDRIVKIDDAPTARLTLEEATRRLRGDPQTRIALTVERAGVAGTTRYDVVREVIHASDVHTRLLRGGVGYLQIDRFSSSVAAELEHAMAGLRSQGAHAWILDLRRNPGGFVAQAVAVADLFLDSGTIVTTEGHGERDEQRAKAAGTDHLPVAVLIDGATASAAEIVTGALKNLDRAVVLGQTTFGKGTVQNTFDLPDGSSAKITIGQYLTPGDISIQSVGIAPDLELDRLAVPQQLGNPTDALRLEQVAAPRESELDAHIVSKYARAPEPPFAIVRLVDGSADAQTELARELIASAHAAHRLALIEELKPLVAQRRATEEQRLEQALAKLKIDWSNHAVTAGARLSLAVTTDKASYAAGETIAITGTVTNTGTSPAVQVHAAARSSDWVFDGTELVFGKLEPGTSRTFTASVQCPADAASRIDSLAWVGSDNLTTAPTKIAIAALPRPQFAYTHQLIDASGDGVAQLGESERLHVRVTNVGAGPALAPAATLRSASGGLVSVVEGRFDLRRLAPGESRDLDFTFELVKDYRDTDGKLKGYADTEAVVELSIYDPELRELTREKLHFPLRPAVATRHAAAIGEVTPPRLALAPLTLETAADHATVSGTATDDTHVEDVYVVVSNREQKIDRRKVFYVSNRGKKSATKLDFTARVPLWPGSNFIAVVARETDQVSTVTSVYVLRSAP